MKKSIYLLMLMATVLLTCCSDDDDSPIMINNNYDLEWVNLGLPSGTLWANKNVDARNTMVAGGYYGWGECETKDKDNYDKDHCPTYYKEIPDIAGNIEYDIARRLLGDNASIPTVEQWKELCKECKWTRHNHLGTEGVLVTGPSNAYIFLPAAGYIHAGQEFGVGRYTIYWSSTPAENDIMRAYHLDCWEDEAPTIKSITRYIGMPIRAVRK